MLDSNTNISKIIKKQTEETPMERLVSMGFANRTLNDRLLKKYNHNMEKVIKDLLDRVNQ